jgi:hypothetical protein
MDPNQYIMTIEEIEEGVFDDKIINSNIVNKIEKEIFGNKDLSNAEIDEIENLENDIFGKVETNKTPLIVSPEKDVAIKEIEEIIVEDENKETNEVDNTLTDNLDIDFIKNDLAENDVLKEVIGN